MSYWAGHFRVALPAASGRWRRGVVGLTVRGLVGSGRTRGFPLGKRYRLRVLLQRVQQVFQGSYGLRQFALKETGEFADTPLKFSEFVVQESAPMPDGFDFAFAVSQPLFG